MAALKYRYIANSGLQKYKTYPHLYSGVAIGKQAEA